MLLTAWLRGPVRALTSLITYAHLSLFTAFCRHLLTFISRTSFCTSSTHLSLGLPFLLLPSGNFGRGHSNLFLFSICH